MTLATESDALPRADVGYLKELGWGLYSFDQECGRGQYEFDFGYADALTMADRFVFSALHGQERWRSRSARSRPSCRSRSPTTSAAARTSTCRSPTSRSGANVFAPGRPAGQARARATAWRVSDLALHFIAGCSSATPRAITAVDLPELQLVPGARRAGRAARVLVGAGAGRLGQEQPQRDAAPAGQPLLRREPRRRHVDQPVPRRRDLASPPGSRASSGSSIRASR